MLKFPLVFLTMTVPLNELPPSPVCLVRALALLHGKARYILPAAILSIAHILSASARNVRSTNICPLSVFSANVVPWLQLLAVALDAWTFSTTYFLASMPGLGDAFQIGRLNSSSANHTLE